MNLEQHLIRQMAWSHATFGPGERTKGVLDHIRKELVEVEEANGESSEWVDVVILALDGLTRRLAYVNGERKDPQEVATNAVNMIKGKQSRNEARDWPNWRESDPDKATEHVETKRSYTHNDILEYSFDALERVLKALYIDRDTREDTTIKIDMSDFHPSIELSNEANMTRFIAGYLNEQE